MDGFYNDPLQIYRGKDYIVKEGIVIHQPTLGEICDYGERDYFSMIHTLTATPADMSWQLNDVGIDFTEITDYQLFFNILCKELPKEQTSIILGDLDLGRFNAYVKSEDQSVVLYDEESDLLIDELNYTILVGYLRSIHNLTRNNTTPYNNAAKVAFIEDEKERYLMNQKKEYKSHLKNLVSAMINCEGFKYGHNEVWDMKIYAFMDSVQRIMKIKKVDLMLQSGYSGFGIDLKKLKNEELNWVGEL